MLRGWSNYFGYGTRLMAYRAVDRYVYHGVRSFLRRRHKVPSRGTILYSDAVVFGTLGVLRLRDVHLPAPTDSLMVITRRPGPVIANVRAVWRSGARRSGGIT